MNRWMKEFNYEQIDRMKNQNRENNELETTVILFSKFKDVNDKHLLGFITIL